MSYITIIFLAYALSIDACLVSFSYGLVCQNNCLKNSIKISSTTGIFQGLMPIIGYYLVNPIREYILIYADLIVFLIFTYLGIKFIENAFVEKQVSPIRIKKRNLFLIGIATSIDAFASGMTLSLSGNNILKPALLIGIITFINSIIGFYAGKKLHHMPTKILEILAGCLLIIIGISNLF